MRDAAAMDAKKLPTKQPAWKAFAISLFGVYLFCFAGYNLYEWYSTGQIYLHNYSRPHWRTFSDEPILFSLIATVYLIIFLALGVGSIARFVAWLKRR